MSQVPQDTHTHEDRVCDISRRAQMRLQSSGYSALRQVSCICDREVLTLTGLVNAYYLKQVAQATVAKVPGVSRIENRIAVRSPACMKSTN